MTKCATTITSDEEVAIKQAMPALINTIRDKGEISDNLLDEMGIRTTTNKDRLVLYRRRSVILTNATFVRSEEQKRIEKETQKLAKDEKSRATKAKRKATQDAKGLSLKAARTTIEEDIDSEDNNIND